MKKYEQLLKLAISRNGIPSQISKAAEEAGELSVVLMQWINKPTERAGLFEKVIEEMADVKIMLEQLQSIFDVDGLLTARAVQWKLARLARRLGESVADLTGILPPE